jgi:NADPH:quinone reductase-like Zn-dependent oxidoreductase
MQAWQLVRFGSPETAFRKVELPDPVPGAGEVLVEVEASGLNFADILARSGSYQDCPPLPCVLGYEVVGRIRALGAGDTLGLRTGERVVAFTRFGGYASQVVTRAIAVARIPETLPAVEAAALATQGATAWYMAEDLQRLHAGDRVLVQAAAGGVGLILCQLAKARGCIVYGTASNPAKLEFLRSIGVDHPMDYSKENFAEAIRRIQGRQGPGLDVVFDSLGGRAFSEAKGLLAAGGRIFCFGVADASSEKKSFSKMLKLAWGFGVTSPIPWLMKSQGFVGVNMLRISDDRPETLKRCLEGVVDFWKTGQLKLHAGGVFSERDITQAHQALGSRGTIGKVILKWG